MISIIIAAGIFLALIPFLLVIAIIVWIDDGRPLLYKQIRVGRNSTHFGIYKFRTMRNDTPDVPTHLLINPGEYITRCGTFLRKYSLDELPQILNVLMGDLNFIGPRPALHNQVDLISKRKNLGIHKIKPGVTGWAQVNGRDELSIDEKVELDYYYFKNQSLYLDLKILLMTFIKVLKADGVKTK